MESACIRQTELPGTTRLFADLVYHPDRTAAFYPWPHDRMQALESAAARVDFPPERRAALVKLLREENGDSALLDLLSQEGTLAVMTGQQVGLFSGPAYTVYKALTAVKLARELTEKGIPAVPIFWLATEDHDFAEVNQTWVFNAQYEASRLSADLHPDAERPVGEIEIPQVPLAEMREALSGLPFAEDAVEMVESAYPPGTTFGKGFGQLVRKMLGSYELLQIDPMSKGFRELAAPIVERALDAAPDLNRQLLERNKELDAAGYHAQVHVEPETSLFFLLQDGKRLALRRQNGDYLHRSQRFTTAELRKRATDLSPNALLRPVIQDYVLPTVAYIGGPAELAYLAQSEVLYRTLLGRQPVALHRSGFTVIENHSHKLLHRYGLCVQDFFHGPEKVKSKIAAKLMPPNVAQTIADTKATCSTAIRELTEVLRAFDQSLEKALGTSRRKMEYQLAKIEAKAGRQLLARDERATHDANMLNGLIYPHKHLQERFYSMIPLIARHGTGLIDEVYEAIQLDCPDHQILVA